MVGISVGLIVGVIVGAELGRDVGEFVGAIVGAVVGSSEIDKRWIKAFLQLLAHKIRDSEHLSFKITCCWRICRF